MKFKHRNVFMYSFALFFMTLGLINNNPTKTHSLKAAAPNIIGLGYSFNFVKDNYLDPASIKTNAPVLDEAWQKQLSTDDRIVVSYANESSTYMGSSNKITSLQEEITKKLDIEDSASFMNQSLNLGFSLEKNNYYTSTASHYWYYHKFEYIYYVCNLPNYAADLSEINSNLHPSYLNNLNKAFSGNISFDDFFDIYGTHLIAKAKYGGTSNFYYNIVSNTLDVGEKEKYKIDAALKLQVGNAFSNNTNASFSLESALNKKTEGCTEKMRITSIGGEPFSATSFNDFTSNFYGWKSTILAYPSIIGVTNGGLVPLYKLIPDTYSQSQKNQFMVAFENYVKKYKTDLSGYDEVSFKYADVNQVQYSFELRNTEKRMTDDGRWKNYHDTLDLNSNLYNASGYGLDIFRKNDFKYIDVKYTADMKEIYHGYQHIFLYSNEEDLGNNSNLLWSKTIELNGNSKQTSYTTKTYTISNILLSELPDNLIVFRYAASGSQDDDWMNKNIRVDITLRK